MHIDDRLATVLSASATGEMAAVTQYRQLIDLLGRLPANATGGLAQEGFARIEELSAILPARLRAAVLRDPALKLCNPRLLSLLAEDEPEVAVAAITAARLLDSQWQALIPRFPVRARGFLRHRKDLGEGASNLLARLGVRDLVLTAPVTAQAAEPLDLAEIEPLTEVAEDVAEPATKSSFALGEPEEIAVLLRRIEAFRKSRGRSAMAGPEAPHLPLAELQESTSPALLRAFDFATDPSGRIIWADPAAAPMVVGASIAHHASDAPLRADAETVARCRRHLPIVAGRLTMEGAPAISGEWQMDATPQFAPAGGRFTGYCGRLRRPSPLPASAGDPAGERIRELLHELRTPVNAIQGFAEIIQQQLFGPSPHEYRSLAAAIAADAARLLAGFDELDRLARLETGALDLGQDGCDLVALLRGTALQLEPFLRSRSAALVIDAADVLPLVVLGEEDAARLVWRLLATLASAATPGEELAIAIRPDGRLLRAQFEMPISYAGRDDIFTAAAIATPQALSAGMFGHGFSLRLARAEARSAGGDLIQDGEHFTLTLQLYKGSPTSRGDEGCGAQGEVQSA